MHARALEWNNWTNAGPNSSHCRYPRLKEQDEKRRRVKEGRREGRCGEEKVVSFYEGRKPIRRTSDRRRMFIFLFWSRSRILSRIYVKAKLRFSVSRCLARVKYNNILNSIAKFKINQLNLSRYLTFDYIKFNVKL